MSFPIPVPMRPEEVISVKQAAHQSALQERIIRRWSRDYGIGRQAEPGSPLQISAVALEMRLCGDDVALELLRLNRRTEPKVCFYLERLGFTA